MAKTKATFQKREREKQRAQKQRDKDARKAENNKERRSQAERRAEGGEDPDLAGIVPGPQPLPPEFGTP